MCLSESIRVRRKRRNRISISVGKRGIRKYAPFLYMRIDSLPRATGRLCLEGMSKFEKDYRITDKRFYDFDTFLKIDFILALDIELTDQVFLWLA